MIVLVGDVLYFNSTIGIIGDSPNGIMLARTAKRMGFRVLAYGTDENNPTLNEADMKFVGNGFDKLKLQDFAQRCDVVTYESTQVSVESLRFIQQYTNLVQGCETLELMQDRLVERAFFEQLNLNVAPYATVVGLDDIYQAVTSIGYPCVLKPIQKNYGKQREVLIQKQTDIANCAGVLELGTYILESYLSRAKEISVIVALDRNKRAQVFSPVECVYQKQDLHKVLTPINLEKTVQQELWRQVKEIVSELNYVGVLKLGFYLTASQMIYVKDVVPALHPAGYLFDKATNISMFEQHIRALANIPLVTPKLLQPTVQVMINEQDQGALRTQLVLKDNWFYNYYRYPEALQKQTKQGYLLVLADNVLTANQQIEATGIWE